MSPGPPLGDRNDGLFALGLVAKSGGVLGHVGGGSRGGKPAKKKEFQVFRRARRDSERTHQIMHKIKRFRLVSSG
jgi:hypothetical protein